MAVLDTASESFGDVRPADLSWEAFRAGGPGGQKQNKTSSAVRVRHLPTGLVAESREEASQMRNKERALGRLRGMLRERVESAERRKTNGKRRADVGSGMRGDKIRTYRVQDDRVVDHRSGRKGRLGSILKGDWSALK